MTPKPLADRSDKEPKESSAGRRRDRVPPLPAPFVPQVSPAGVSRDLSDREFEVFRALVTVHTGITLGPHKRALLQARLGKRLRALGLATFADYYRLLVEQDPDGEELVRLVNTVTTNRTGFYREPHHFAYLAEGWVPDAVSRAAHAGQRVVRIWSAGCSTGEEPYTIAMTLADALGHSPGWDVRILASDIDTDVLRRAAAGIYSVRDVESIPPNGLRRHFLRGTGPRSGFVRIQAALRGLITFRRINLLQEPWPIGSRFDLIFCRNVLIYFDQATQQRLVARLAGLLTDGGALIFGHSEYLHGSVSGIRHIGNTIYRKEVGYAENHSHR